MTRAITALIRRAAMEQSEQGVVSADTEAELAAEGYLLSALEKDINQIIEKEL